MNQTTHKRKRREPERKRPKAKKDDSQHKDDSQQKGQRPGNRTLGPDGPPRPGSERMASPAYAAPMEPACCAPPCSPDKRGEWSREVERERVSVCVSVCERKRGSNSSENSVNKGGGATTPSKESRGMKGGVGNLKQPTEKSKQNKTNTNTNRAPKR